MTEKDKENFAKATVCHICKKPFVNKGKVRDYCHITGKFRGAAHFKCNLSWRNNPEEVKIPVFFHNLRGYDAHLIMQEIHRSTGSLSCLANNTERYVTFSIGCLQFTDSIQFLSASLDRLTENTLKSEGEDGFPISKKWGNWGKNYTNWEDRFKLLTRKGIYPYDVMDSRGKLFRKKKSFTIF